MIEQTDVDALVAELTEVRAAMQRDRASLTARLTGLVSRAQRMRDDAAGGRFEPAIASVHDLLQSLQRGVVAQDTLNALR
jgi:hypothetical protein